MAQPLLEEDARPDDRFPGAQPLAARRTGKRFPLRRKPDSSRTGYRAGSRPGSARLRLFWWSPAPRFRPLTPPKPDDVGPFLARARSVPSSASLGAADGTDKPQALRKPRGSPNTHRRPQARAAQGHDVRVHGLWRGDRDPGRGRPRPRRAPRPSRRRGAARGPAARSRDLRGRFLARSIDQTVYCASRAAAIDHPRTRGCKSFDC